MCFHKDDGEYNLVFKAKGLKQRLGLRCVFSTYRT